MASPNAAQQPIGQDVKTPSELASLLEKPPSETWQYGVAGVCLGFPTTLEVVSLFGLNPKSEIAIRDYWICLAFCVAYVALTFFALWHIEGSHLREWFRGVRAAHAPRWSPSVAVPTSILAGGVFLGYLLARPLPTVVLTDLFPAVERAMLVVVGIWPFWLLFSSATLRKKYHRLRPDQSIAFELKRTAGDVEINLYNPDQYFSNAMVLQEVDGRKSNSGFRVADKHKSLNLRTGDIVLLNFDPICQLCEKGALDETAGNLTRKGRLELIFDPIGESTIFAARSVKHAKELFKSAEQGVSLLRSCLQSIVGSLSQSYNAAIEKISVDIELATKDPNTYLKNQNIRSRYESSRNSLNIPFDDLFQKEKKKLAAEALHGAISSRRISFSAEARKQIPQKELEEFWSAAFKCAVSHAKVPEEENVIIALCRFVPRLPGEPVKSGDEKPSGANALLSNLEQEWRAQSADAEKQLDAVKNRYSDAVNEFIRIVTPKLLERHRDPEALAALLLRITALQDPVDRMLAVESLLDSMDLPKLISPKSGS